jgi:hypothetical protein
MWLLLMLAFLAYLETSADIKVYNVHLYQTGGFVFLKYVKGSKHKSSKYVVTAVREKWTRSELKLVRHKYDYNFSVDKYRTLRKQSTKTICLVQNIFSLMRYISVRPFDFDRLYI